ncbi:hypothetical protein J6590_083098 [Homalodisca vitripennis]|nr:hypothetical protein J6590_083098 [Homalodisca vitripennis]
MSAEDPSIPNTSVDNNFIEFQKFIKKFEREYRNFEEFELRYKIFLESLKSIDELNNAPGQTATFGVTHFADRTGQGSQGKKPGLEIREKSGNPVLSQGKVREFRRWSGKNIKSLYTNKLTAAAPSPSLQTTRRMKQAAVL